MLVSVKSPRPGGRARNSGADLNRPWLLGREGKARARELYDWPPVFRQYPSLWRELNARRAAAANDPAELAWTAAAARASPARLDAFKSFAHYPTALIGFDTRVAPPAFQPAGPAP
jgi:hypothetical protein